MELAFLLNRKFTTYKYFFRKIINIDRNEKLYHGNIILKLVQQKRKSLNNKR